MPSADPIATPETDTDSDATVLIIDDSPENRYVVRRALTRAGMTVREAGTGAEGARLAAEGPDLIVLDVNLPDTTGFELCRQLKRDPSTAHVPVIHLSQSAVDDSSRVRGLDGGADAYLTDPIRGSVLVATVRALLRMRRAEDALRRQALDADLFATLSSMYASAATGAEVIRALLDMHAQRFPIRRATLFGPLGAGTGVRSPWPEDGRTVYPRDPGEVPGDPVPLAAAEIAQVIDGMLGDPHAQAPRVVYEEDEPGDWAIVPLVAYRRQMGVLLIEYTPGTALSAHYQARLLEAATRGAEALERAELFEVQRAIASDLQASLLPAALPRVPGVALAAQYRAGAGGTFVGGDFYDVFQGVTGWVALIGDVCGQGAIAAARTSLARHTARQAARQDDHPASILRALQAAIDADERIDQLDLVSAICLRLEPHAGGTRVRFAVAGHPLPIFVGADASVAEIGSPGTILGIDPDVRYALQERELGPGDTLFLYTDGVTESRQGRELFGEERLIELLGELARSGASEQELAREVVAAASSFNELHADDMATLVLRAVSTAPEVA